MPLELYRRARRAEAKAERHPDRRRLRVDFFRAALAEGLESLKARHADGASGQESVRAHARFVDELIGSLVRLITTDLAAETLAAETLAAEALAAEPFVVVALGGYGRGELHPSSDID